MVTVPGYTKDWSWREEDVAEVANKILEFKKVNHLPKFKPQVLCQLHYKKARWYC